LNDSVDGKPPVVTTPLPWADFPFAYGKTTLENPWETIVPDYCQGPDILYADAVLHAGMPAWVPRRLADLRTVYADTTHFSNADMAPFAPLVGQQWQVLPLEADPPAHGRYRGVLNPAFTPKAIARLDEKMRLAARGHAATMRDAGRCDFMAAFSLKFPILVFLELMGMPESMAPQFLDWENGLLHSPELDTLAAATREVERYLRGAIEERKHRPGDDLISHAVSSRTAAEGALSDDELLGICFNLFIGGLDSVSTNMGWQFFHLATHPLDQRRLREDPALIPAAVDELQRYYAAVTTYRRCIRPFEIAGVTIQPGEYVAMSTTVAGRDDRAYSNPNVVDLGRRPRHVAFGYGPHACLGLHLARREMRIALEEFLTTIPEFRLSADAPIRTLLHSTIQPVSVPIEWAA
jgi:cytochrome P450